MVSTDLSCFVVFSRRDTIYSMVYCDRAALCKILNASFSVLPNLTGSLYIPRCLTLVKETTSRAQNCFQYSSFSLDSSPEIRTTMGRQLFLITWISSWVCPWGNQAEPGRRWYSSNHWSRSNSAQTLGLVNNWSWQKNLVKIFYSSKLWGPPSKMAVSHKFCIFN